MAVSPIVRYKLVRGDSRLGYVVKRDAVDVNGDVVGGHLTIRHQNFVVWI